MPVLFLTFGVQYGVAEEAAAAFAAGRTPPDPHPTADWATGKGYLAVEYSEPEAALSDDQPRRRARAAAHAWLGGVYAFEYDEAPSPEHAPFGEVARMVLP